MKKLYMKPMIDVIRMEYICYIAENSGEIGYGGDDYEAKQNDIIFEDSNDLWGDEEEY